MNNWIPILMETLLLDKSLLIRTADSFGLGRNFEVVNFDSNLFTAEEVVCVIQNQGDYVEFMEVPE